jgi:hypothetical protein
MKYPIIFPSFRLLFPSFSLRCPKGRLVRKAKRLPASVELLALELPGRGCRMSEAALAAATLTELAMLVLDGIGLVELGRWEFIGGIWT